MGMKVRGDEECVAGLNGAVGTPSADNRVFLTWVAAWELPWKAEGGPSTCIFPKLASD
jgi:hypothetical protein